MARKRTYLVGNYVSLYYKKTTYLKSYEGTITPVPSSKFWPNVEASYNPPPIKIMPGRPKKNRRKNPHEDPKRPGKLTRHGFVVTCSLCKIKGHNKRGCSKKDTSGLSEPPTTRPRGRPRKDMSVSVSVPSQLSEATNPTPSHYERGAEPSRKGKGRSKGATSEK